MRRLGAPLGRIEPLAGLSSFRGDLGVVLLLHVCNLIYSCKFIEMITCNNFNKKCLNFSPKMKTN